jgi:hypothetical protein
MPITVKHLKVSTVPDAGDDTLVEPSDWNADHTLTGLGTMAEQNANSVAITGGTISGVTIPASSVTGTLGVPNGGTGATTLTGYVKGTGTTAMTASATIPNTDITGLGTASTRDAGVALGVATLDAAGKVPVTELPDAVLGALSYQGTWNASTNTPTLTSSVGTKGYYYVVSVAGSTNLDGITDWLVGDWAVYNGTAWQKVDNTDSVTSVNGFTGAVSLTTTNINEGTNLYYTDTRSRAAISAGTGISYDNTTGVITNSSPSLGGDVVGPTGATDNAVARYDTTTGKLIQNSLVIIGDTGSVTGVNALTAESLTVNNNATLGSSNTDTLDVNARITTDLDPNANNAKDIGSSGRNWRDGFFGRTVHTVNLELTGTTSFDGAQGTSGQVLTSAGTGNTPTWTTPTTGTVTSVDATAGTGISVSGGPITTSGSLTITNTAPDQVVSLTGAGTTSISGTYPNFTISSDDQFDGTVTSVDLTAGTGISVSGGPITSSGSITVTNTAPDQVVSLTGAGTTSISGTYPNFTITSNDSTVGTVTSVGGTGTVNGISLSGTVTSSGNLTLGGALSGVDLTSQVTGTLPIANGGTGETTRQAALDALAGSVTSGQYLRGDGTDVVMSAIQAGDVPTLNQNTTGSAGSVANALTAGTGLTASATFNGSAAVTFDATGTTINSQTSAYTLVATDAGKTISITTGGVTIPNAVMAAGNIVTIYNNSGSSQTITQGASLTLQWAGQATSSTGNRTLGLHGMVSVLFISSSVAVISGAGLT